MAKSKRPICKPVSAANSCPDDCRIKVVSITKGKQHCKWFANKHDPVENLRSMKPARSILKNHDEAENDCPTINVRYAPHLSPEQRRLTTLKTIWDHTKSSPTKASTEIEESKPTFAAVVRASSTEPSCYRSLKLNQEPVGITKLLLDYKAGKPLYSPPGRSWKPGKSNNGISECIDSRTAMHRLHTKVMSMLRRGVKRPVRLQPDMESDDHGTEETLQLNKKSKEKDARSENLFTNIAKTSSYERRWLQTKNASNTDIKFKHNYGSESKTVFLVPHIPNKKWNVKMSPPKPRKLKRREYLFHSCKAAGIQANLGDLVAKEVPWPGNTFDYSQLMVSGNQSLAKYRHLRGKCNINQRSLQKCNRCITRRKQSQKQTKSGHRRLACQNVSNKVRIALVTQVQEEQPLDPSAEAGMLNRWDDELKSQNTNPPLAFIHNYHWMIRLLFASLNLKEGRMACRTCTIIN